MYEQHVYGWDLKNETFGKNLRHGRDYICGTVGMGVEEKESEKLMPGRICGAGVAA